MNRDVESFADFVQYYQGKFVLSSTDPKKMYLIGNYADPLRQSIAATAYRNGRTETQAPMKEAQVWDELQFGLPNIGMTVFYRHELVYLYYRTQRNGGRGYGIDRVVNHSFNGLAARENGLPITTREQLGHARMAWQAMRQVYRPLDAAWNDLTSETPKRLAYALNQQFGVYLSAQEYPALCYKMYEIGEVLSPTKVRLDAKHREYKDLILRSLNPDMEVTVR